MQEKIYTYCDCDGELRELNPENMANETYCIFGYKNGDDLNVINRQTPMIFNDAGEFLAHLKSMMENDEIMTEFLNNDQTIVIRKIKTIHTKH